MEITIRNWAKNLKINSRKKRYKNKNKAVKRISIEKKNGRIHRQINTRRTTEVYKHLTNANYLKIRCTNSIRNGWGMCI
jgi:hypothetical protein